MDDNVKRLQRVALSIGQLLYLLAVMTFGLAIQGITAAARYSGGMYAMSLIGAIITAVCLPVMLIALGHQLRRVARQIS